MGRLVRAEESFSPVGCMIPILQRTPRACYANIRKKLFMTSNVGAFDLLGMGYTIRISYLTSRTMSSTRCIFVSKRKEIT